MSEAREVRIAVVGVGYMGAIHARDLSLGKVPRASLAAVCDTDPEALARFEGVACFSNIHELLASGLATALIIATPHYDHTPLAILALAAGLHVLTEKPLAVHAADCLKMIEAYERRPEPGQVFAEMLNLRAEPRFLKVRELLRQGELGTLRRVHWVVTDCFRSEAYYRSAAWRATFRGEGGGALLNQGLHYLDLWQWLFGMPARVHAFCGFGRFHEIEVEDQVTAYLEYEHGKNGVFVTSTAEAPGTNQLEVVGDLGKIVLDGERLLVTRNATSTMDAIRHGPARRAMPLATTEELSFSAGGDGRNAVVRNFVSAILEGEALIAPASEGICSVELGNAMIYSGLTRETVELPLDPALYAARLARLIQRS